MCAGEVAEPLIQYTKRRFFDLHPPYPATNKCYSIIPNNKHVSLGMEPDFYTPIETPQF
jgi:hypothetical protein